MLPRFRDGAWLCELAAVRDPDGVVDAVAGVFRVSARPGSSLEESLVAYLRDQELLVVLDNCEHLLRAVARPRRRDRSRVQRSASVGDQP